MKFFHKILISLGAALIFIFAYFFIGWPAVNSSTVYGVTWSKNFAEFLGLNSTDGLRAVLDELQVKHVRIPVYWTEVEEERGTFTTEWLKQQLDLIAAYRGTATLVVGAKQPRWPECWIPDWVKKLPLQEQQMVQLNYLHEIKQQFDQHSAVVAWQVENEPDLKFGDCPPQDKKFVEQEMALMHQTSHPVYTTASGELSSWMGYVGHTDGVGVSVYRVVTTERGGVFKYFFLPPWFYQRKALLIQWFTGPIYISEFQMEPWINGNIVEQSPEQQFRTFTIDQMKKNLWFAERTGFSHIDLWGAEWWYWMKTQKQHPEFWNMAKAFFLKS